MSILVQLPDTAQTFIDEQVASGHFGSANDFIANLVEQARRKAAHERVEHLLWKVSTRDHPLRSRPNTGSERRKSGRANSIRPTSREN